MVPRVLRRRIHFLIGVKDGNLFAVETEAALIAISLVGVQAHAVRPADGVFAGRTIFDFHPRGLDTVIVVTTVTLKCWACTRKSFAFLSIG